MTQEALKLALEALEKALHYHGVMLLSDPPQDAWKYHRVEQTAHEAITAIKEALAEHAMQEVQRLGQEIEQEPVAWVCEGSSSDEKHGIDYWPGDVDDLPIGTQLYAAPPAQQWNAGVPPLYPKPEPGVSIKAEYDPTQSMHPEIKKMYEDYFDKCFRESSSAVPENFIDALRFDVAVRDAREWEKVDMREHAEGNLGIGTAPPPQRKWVGLTDQEIWETISRIGTSDSDVNPYAKLSDARAIEAKLKEKNNAA